MSKKKKRKKLNNIEPAVNEEKLAPSGETLVVNALENNEEPREAPSVSLDKGGDDEIPSEKCEVENNTTDDGLKKTEGEIVFESLESSECDVMEKDGESCPESEPDAQDDGGDIGTKEEKSQEFPVKAGGEEGGGEDWSEDDSDEEELDPKTNLRGWIGAIILSIVMAMIPLWELIGRLNTHYVGGGELEGWLWRYWWMKELLSSLWAQTPRNIGSIIYIYFCAGNYPETGNVFDLQTFSLILEPIFGDPAYYNVKIFLILFLNGISGYALCKYITGRPIASMLGAAVMAVNPYVTFEIANGRPRQAMLFTMPLFIMYLLDNYRTLSLKSALLAGFWLGLTAAVYLYYGLAALLFGLIFLIYHLLTDRINFSFTFVKYVLLILMVFVLVSGPFSFRYVELVLKGEKLPETTYGRDFPDLDFLLQTHTQLDPRDPLSHSILRYRDGSQSADFPFNFSYLTNTPLVITILVLLPLLFVRPVPWLFVITMVFFYLLSLGPYLRIGGNDGYYVRLLSGEPVKLPYVWFFKYVPFFSRLFAPIRVLGMFYVAVGAIVAINMKYITEEISKKIKLLGFLRSLPAKVAIALIVLVLMITQMYWVGQVPLTLTKLEVPEIYLKLREKKARLGIVEVPFRIGDFINLYQVFHEKKLLWAWTYGGIPGNFPDSEARYLATPDFLMDNSFISFLEDLNKSVENPREFQPADLERLRDAGYKYLIVHERSCFDLDPERGADIYDYFLRHIGGYLGPPVEMGLETSIWKMQMTLGPTPTFRMAIFRIP